MSSQRGFSLAELLVAAAFFMTVSGIGLALLGSALPSVRTDGEVNRLIGILQVARETAITRQRDVEVRIDTDSNSVLVVRHEEGDEVPLRQLIFEYNVSFVQFDGMGDSPDAYGNASAVDFGEAVSMTFAPDGSFLAEDNMPLNGTFFLGVAGRPETARALTLTSATARPRLYTWAGDGAGWVPR